MFFKGYFLLTGNCVCAWGCAWMCVCTVLTLRDRESKWRNRFYSLLSQKLASDCEMEIYNNNNNERKKEEARSRRADLVLDSWVRKSDFSNFIFVLVHLNIISCSWNIHPGSHECHTETKSVTLASGLCGSKAGHGPRLRSPVPPSDCHVTRTRTALYPIRSVQENIQTCAHRQRNSARGGHSSASMLAPKLRMTAMKSIVYLGDDLKSASLWCPRLFSAVRSSVYVPVDTCQSVYVNVQMFFLFVCLFVCLFEFCKQKGAQLNWSAIDICSSSSSEQLYLSVLAPGPSNRFPNIIYHTSLFP